MGRLRRLINICVFALFLLQTYGYGALAAKKPYIVYMGAHFHGPNPTEEHFELAANSHRQFLASYVGSYEKANDAIIYSYTRNINGFFAILEEEHATEIAKHPSVVSVFMDRAKKLHTTRSWDFMHLSNNGVALPNSLWTKASFGEDLILSHLDTGVWPESASFSDDGYGPIPKRWKGSCKGGPGFKCNKKLIGAGYYYKGFISAGGNISKSEISARDVEGHGSHTLSTVGGNFVNASILGVDVGIIKGGSPRARVASYKVCWPMKDGGCFDSDILMAMDQAIHDGVDIISISLGGDPSDYFSDGIAIGSFHAVTKGIPVIASAGNNGSYSMVSNAAPWLFTVAASTIDRKFEADVALGNGLRFAGYAGISGALNFTFYPLTSGAQAKRSSASATEAMLCKAGSLDPSKVKGKILACLRGDIDRVEKSRNANEAGAVGMILCNDEGSGNDVMTDLHYLPTSNIGYQDGLQLFSYVQSTKEPIAYITPPTTVLNVKPAPVMAFFTSRGPNVITPDILKPDVTAPGVDIIAAFSEKAHATNEPFDTRSVSFNVLEGTSMACPHVAGVVGLLKSLYPHWSPATIRSAIMTTAIVKDNTMGPIIDGADNSIANPFVYGSGHINPNGAMNPGLVYDLEPNHYLHYLCALGYNDTQIQVFVEPGHHYKCHRPKESIVLHFNYPSISVPELRRGESVTLRRKVTNVGPPGTYSISVNQPKDASVHVYPKTLAFKATGVAKSFKIKVKGLSSSGGYTFGDMSWSDGKHNVRSTIAVNVIN